MTAYELQQAGVDVTLICDNMASAVMQQGWVQAVLGRVRPCRRQRRHGEQGRHLRPGCFGQKLWNPVLCLCAVLYDWTLPCEDGSQIIIEERPAEEVTKLWYQQPMAPEGIAVYNPSFDVTGHELVTAFITEYGILHPPFAKLHCKEDKNDSIR